MDTSSIGEKVVQTPQTPLERADTPKGVRGVGEDIGEVGHPSIASSARMRAPFAPFSVAVGDHPFPVSFWSGERLSAPRIGLDTETEMIEGLGIPNLALAAAATPEAGYIVHPAHLPWFMEAHADREVVFHNAAFDFWVLHRYLTEVGRADLAAVLFDAVAAGRVHDSMLLDQLIRLGRDGNRDPFSRALDVVASEWAGIDELNKNDPYRTRYGEIIGRDWREVKQGFFGYAAKDPIATLLAYEQMVPVADALMVEHEADIHPDARERFGLLTENVQVAGAIALATVERNGIHVDSVRHEKKREGLFAEITKHVNGILAVDDWAGIFKRDRDGELKMTKGGVPSITQKELDSLLHEAASEAGVAAPLNDKRKAISRSAKKWEPVRKKLRDIRRQRNPDYYSPSFLDCWIEMEESRTRLKYVGFSGKHLHPKYRLLVETGRTGASGPCIQQIPRDGGFREMFIPSPGHVFLAIDYSFVELVTLAATCRHRFGHSTLADIIAAGHDPHVNRAVLISGMTAENYTALKAADPGEAKALRQKAKAIGFGVPGGLGAAGLLDYAKSNYGADLQLQEAEEFRTVLVTRIYPELSQYLTSRSMAALARRLGATEKELWVALGFPVDRPEWLPKVVAKILAGNPFKRTGEPYRPYLVDSIWGGLYACCRNPELRPAIMTRQTGPEMAKLAMEDGVTISGRVRSRLSYTQARNSPFQSLAADGAKLACFELIRGGYRLVAFIHDEFIIELPADADHAAEARKIERTICDAMSRVVFGMVPVKAEYALSTCWSKKAEKIEDEHGRLLPWSPDHENKKG